MSDDHQILLNLQRNGQVFARRLCSRLGLVDAAEAPRAATGQRVAHFLSGHWAASSLTTELMSVLGEQHTAAIIIDNAAERFDDLSGITPGEHAVPNAAGLHPFAPGLVDRGWLADLDWTETEAGGCFPALVAATEEDSGDWLVARIDLGTGLGVALRRDADVPVADDAQLQRLLGEVALPLLLASARQHLGFAVQNQQLTHRVQEQAGFLTTSGDRVGDLRRKLDDAGLLNATMTGRPAASPPPWLTATDRPALSYVVIGYEMDREVNRTVVSALPPFQQGVERGQIEVVVVDNGSPEPLVLSPQLAERPDVRLIRVEPGEAGLAKAMNRGAAESKGHNVAMMIDGAHLLSPGVSRWALTALETFQEPVVALQRFFLGENQQTDAFLHGYDQSVEDQMLEEIDWVNNGYRLFERSVLTGDNRLTWMSPLFESNCLIMSQDVYRDIGGADERFEDPAGGFLNLDLFNKAVNRPDSDYVLLTGEASFHQFHGGTTTNAEREDRTRKVEAYRKEYERLFGRKHRASSRVPILLGPASPAMLNARPFSAAFASEHRRMGQQLLVRHVQHQGKAQQTGADSQ